MSADGPLQMIGMGLIILRDGVPGEPGIKRGFHEFQSYPLEIAPRIIVC